jgi:Ca-activated chloride channel homolog
MLEFVYPNWFWALLVLLPYLAFEIFVKNKKQVTLVHSRLDVLKKVAKRNSFLKYIPIILRSIIIILLVVSLTRPRFAHKKQEVKGKGIDIMLAIDISGSMKAVDLKPTNRLEAAKKVANTFIENRRNDRIGLIVFSENAYTQCPLTLDYNILMTIMDKVKINEEANGTAIGMGLAMSVARLKDSEAESKVIILITDGRNNAGEIDPFTAADIAATYGIKVYTVGVGKKGMVDYPVQTRFGTQYQKVKIEIDMETLNKIAKMTGTERARRAQNTEELMAIIKRIDELEKTEIKIENYFQYDELFWNFLLAAMFLLILEFVFKIVIVKTLP